MQEAPYSTGWTLSEAEAASARRILDVLEQERETCEGRLGVYWSTVADRLRQTLFA
jgi:hypothetical protein